jgi:hypothetical protein
MRQERRLRDGRRDSLSWSQQGTSRQGNALAPRCELIGGKVRGAASRTVVRRICQVVLTTVWADEEHE